MLQAVTSGVIAALSDAIVQRLLGATSLSWRRCMLMSLYGLRFYGAPTWLRLIRGA